jgi:hypothetical protein
MELRVYLPTPGRPTTIAAGSGIVGTPQPGGQVLIDYEGNLYRSRSMGCYADRVDTAASRHTTHYPTVARALVPAEHLVHLGFYDPRTGTVDLSGDLELPQARQALADWCCVDPADVDAELSTRAVARHRMLREVHAARASGDPRLARLARQMARRHNL